ncbi:MAG TPA: GNAT family N-acetyltransferase [Rhodocyclaceae bacterium]|nr:GNAT family N-acetyltransferase [Rhodocyclaceae bacterium]
MTEPTRLPPPIFNTRDYRPADAQTLVALFREAILAMGPNAYDDAECKAWAARADDEAAFVRRLTDTWVRVAENDDGIVGFGSIVEPGHIDLLFTAPRAARQGVASLLLEDLVFLGAAMGAKILTVDASRLARPLFLKHGFEEAANVTRCVGDIQLECFRMEGVVPN